jgi:hypothetical protein
LGTKGLAEAQKKRLASCSRDRTIRLWQIGSGECQVLRGHTDDVSAPLALRAEQALGEPVRQAALRAVLRKAQPPAEAPGKPVGPP